MIRLSRNTNTGNPACDFGAWAFAVFGFDGVE